MTANLILRRFGHCSMQMLLGVVLASTSLWRTTAHGADFGNVETAGGFRVELVGIDIDPRAVTSVELGALEMEVMDATTAAGQSQGFIYGDLHLAPIVLRVLQGPGSEGLLSWAKASLTEGSDATDVEISLMDRDQSAVLGQFRAFQCQLSSFGAAAGVDGAKEFELFLEPTYMELESQVELAPIGSGFAAFAESGLAQPPLGEVGFIADEVMEGHQFQVELNGYPVQVAALHGGQVVGEEEASNEVYAARHRLGVGSISELSMDIGIGPVIEEMMRGATRGEDQRYEVVITEIAMGSVISEVHYLDCLVRRIDLPSLSVHERPTATKVRLTLKPTGVNMM